MKFLPLLIFIFFIKISSLYADTGCNLGDDIYPDLTAEIYRDCPSCTAIPVYSTLDKVHLVNTNEAACGVPRNSISYSPGGSCKVKTGPSSYSSGNLNSYDPTLNDCPIDSGVCILLVVFSVVGVLSINKLLVLSSTV